jgi:ribosomal silencing factor RsfS
MTDYIVIASRSVEQQLLLRISAETESKARELARKMGKDDANWRSVDTKDDNWVNYTVVPTEPVEALLSNGKRS